MDEKQEIELYKKLGEDLEEKMNLIEQIFTHSVLPGDRWETAKNALNDLKRSNNLHEAVMYFYDAYGHSLHQIIPNSRQGDAEEKFEKIMRKPASDIGLYGKVKTPFEEVKKAYENGMKFIKKILLKFADNEKLLKCSKEDAKKLATNKGEAYMRVVEMSCLQARNDLMNLLRSPDIKSKLDEYGRLKRGCRPDSVQRVAQPIEQLTREIIVQRIKAAKGERA